MGKQGTCVCDFCKQSEGPYVFGPMTPEAVPPVGANHSNGGTILVQISSFRDPRCGQTVYNVFNRAARPERIHVAIVDQQVPDVDKFDCVALYCALHQPQPCPHVERIQTLRVDARRAEGPIWARGLGTQMIKDEHDFCMQIDAHTDFRNDYDELTLMTWAMTGNEYAVLSTYVGNIRKDINSKGEMIVGLPRHEIPIICRIVSGGHGLVRNHGADGTVCQPGPVLAALWGAGLSFAKCHFERNVPNDPRLAGLFDGEEFARTIRGFTKGYDTYTMHRPTVFHDYGGYPADAISGYGSWKGGQGGQSAKLWRDIILNGKDKGTAWGLGTLRTVEQYINLTAIDPYRPGAQGAEQKRRCTFLKYVPYENDPARLSAPLPQIDTRFPSNVAKGTDALPDVDKKFIAVARRMLPKEASKPRLSAEEQVIQYGVPPSWLWPKASQQQQKNEDSAQLLITTPSTSRVSPERPRDVATTTGTSALGRPPEFPASVPRDRLLPGSGASALEADVGVQKDALPAVQLQLSSASSPTRFGAVLGVVISPIVLSSLFCFCKSRIFGKKRRRAARG